MGGLAGALIGMGIPEYEAKKQCENRIKRWNPAVRALRQFGLGEED